MRIYLAVDVDRTEGMNKSTDLVEQALVEEVSGVALDVEDTQYEVTEVEAVADPSKKGNKRTTGDPKALAEHLNRVADMVHKTFPISIDGPPPPVDMDNAQLLLKEVTDLLYDSRIAPFYQARLR